MEIPTESVEKKTSKKLENEDNSCRPSDTSSISCAVLETQKPSIVKLSTYLYTINCNKSNLSSVDINSKNNLLACGFENPEILVFNLKSLNPKQIKDDSGCDLSEPLIIDENNENNSLLRPNKVLKGHQGFVYGLAFSSPHSLLLSCSEDSSVRAWNTETFNTVAVYGDQNYPIWDVTLSSNGAYFATASMDFAARLWCFERSQPLRIFAGHSSVVNNVKFNVNSHYLATTSGKGIQLWALEDGRTLRRFHGHESRVTCIAFSPNGHHLASADVSGCIKIWDIGTEKEIGAINGHAGGILSIAFSKNNAFLASGGYDKVLKVWDVKHCIDIKSSSNTTETCSSEDFHTTELVNCPPAESSLHYVSFRKKYTLISVASSRRNC